MRDHSINNKFSMIGTAAAVDVNNIKRARYTVQITLCALFAKYEEAPGESVTNMSAYDWLCSKSTENVVSYYWKMVMELEMHILIYVRSIREGNFKIYVEVLRKLLKWFFIFDRYNYSRWLTIQWFDLYNLETNDTLIKTVADVKALSNRVCIKSVFRRNIGKG